MPNRPSIPSAIQREVFVESGHRCAVCGTGLPLERAHIIPWCKVEEHTSGNLICLCANCHQRADVEKWGEKTLKEYKERPWVSRNYENIDNLPVKTAKLRLIVDIEFKDFDETQKRWLQYAVAAFLSTSPQSVKIVDVNEGSTRVTIQLPEDDAKFLIKSYEDKNSDLFEILHPLIISDISSVPELEQNQSPKKSYELICFVSGGFTDRLNKIHEILLKPVSEIVKQITLNDSTYHHQFEISFKRLNETPFIAQDIQKNVFENIRKAHFLIADISLQFQGKKTGDSEVREKEAPNPSVMHEIGYAMALSIPVFLIGESDTRKHLPANLKGSLVTEYECCDDAEKLVEEESAKNFSKNLAEHIVQFIDIAGTPLTPGQFLIEGYRIRLNVNLPYLIRDARFRVYILTTNLQYIESRLKDSIEYALDRNSGKTDTPGPNRSFKIDILTMDPESIVTNIRGRELNRKIDEFRDELRSSLTKFKEFSRSYNPANIEIGTYVSLPTIIMFVIDDTVIFSIPFSSQRSRLVPHFIIANDPRTIQQFIDYFFIVKSRTGGQTLL